MYSECDHLSPAYYLYVFFLSSAFFRRLILRHLIAYTNSCSGMTINDSRD